MMSYPAPLDGFIEIGAFPDEGGDYSWQEWRLYQKISDGMIFSFGDTGCSCYSYEGPENESELYHIQTLAGGYAAFCEALSWDGKETNDRRWTDHVRPLLIEHGIR